MKTNQVRFAMVSACGRTVRWHKTNVPTYYAVRKAFGHRIVARHFIEGRA